METVFVNSPLLFPAEIYRQVMSGEIRWSFEYCEFLKRNKVKRVEAADVRGMLNAGGEL